MSLNGTLGVKSVEKYLIWQIFSYFTTPSSKSNDCRGFTPAFGFAAEVVARSVRFGQKSM